jgi:hypothetical protein
MLNVYKHAIKTQFRFPLGWLAPAESVSGGTSLAIAALGFVAGIIIFFFKRDIVTLDFPMGRTASAFSFSTKRMLTLSVFVLTASL